MFLKLTLWGYGLQSPLKRVEQRKLLALEMDDLKGSAKASRFKKQLELDVAQEVSIMAELKEGTNYLISFMKQ